MVVKMTTGAIHLSELNVILKKGWYDEKDRVIIYLSLVWYVHFWHNRVISNKVDFRYSLEKSGMISHGFKYDNKAYGDWVRA